MKNKILCALHMVGNYSNLDIYKKYYNSFKKYFCKDDLVDFLLVTDKPEKFLELKNNIIIRCCNAPKSRDEALRLKFKLIVADNLDIINKYDYINLTNCNLNCNNYITLNELLNNKKISIVQHSYQQNNFLLNFTFYQLYGNNINTTVNIPIQNKINMIYCQSGIFLSERNLLLEFVEWEERMRLFDEALNKKTIFHDETYFNYWFNMIKNFKDCNILPAKNYNNPITDISQIKPYMKYILPDKKILLNIDLSDKIK